VHMQVASGPLQEAAAGHGRTATAIGRQPQRGQRSRSPSQLSGKSLPLVHTSVVRSSSAR